MATGRIYFKKEYNLFFYLFLLFTVISFFCYKNNFSQDPGNRIISTWFWAQPKPTGTLLYSVHFINQMTGYAAGELGTIIKTTDGGSNWIQLTSNTSNDLSEIFFINNNIGFAVGRSGIVIRTKDGGTRWTQFKTGLNDYLHDVTFINKFTGYIAGLNGTILKTSNSGDSWKKLKTFSGAPLFCLSFLNENEGAAGGYTTILKTSDGGMNWRSQNINFNPSCAIVGISCIDNNTIYAAGNSSAGSFYKSADNGANWISSSLNLPYLFDGSVDLLRSMSFININTGFIVTDFGTILKTTNAGMSWQKDSSFRPSYEKLSVMYDINFRDPGFINISGSGGTIIRSTNSGLNWTARTGNKKTLKGSCFINSKTGFAVGEKGIVLKTEDEGMNWLELNSFTDKFLKSVFL
ncbi:MAG: hypothetical protein IPL53_04865 [Ignavibacteria bacterium]|nr:hypothetical protein [Ignavibacteria bacterium]